MWRAVVDRGRSRSAWALGVWLVMTGLLASSPALAQDPYIPPALAPWVPWVMEAHPELQCAQLQSSFTCGWPGELTLDAEQTQGSFSLEVWLDRPQRVALPGGGKLWPQQVDADGQGAVVLRDDAGLPSVLLSRGQHTVTGRLLWTAPPEVVQFPAEVGVVRLSYLGKPVERPRFDDSGRLWVKEGAGSEVAGEADNQRVAVYRRIVDGVPLKVVTLLELNISGRSRELALGKILIDGSRAVDMRGALPVQISADGEVKVYARPGTHRVEIDAIIVKPVEQLVAPKQALPFFDPQEVWVWRPDEATRSVEIAGLTTVDPARTSLPQEWRGDTTLLAEGGQALKLTVTRRGEAQPSPNQLTLSRTMWLDLDGKGYTIRDTLQGTLHQGWRLNYGADGVLGRVSRGAEELLITADVETQQQGVELREGALGLEAESRFEVSTVDLPIVGWSHDVQSLSVDLNLPPGWSVLGARGVDQMTNTWIDTWSLFEFFILLLIAGAMGRLFGWPWGLIAALAMIFSHGQDEAPRYVWFSLVASLALLRVLPEKLWVRWIVLGYLTVSFLWFVAVFAPFAHKQVRYALNPQVQPTYSLPLQNIANERASGYEQLEQAASSLDAPIVRRSDSIMIESGGEAKDSSGWDKSYGGRDGKKKMRSQDLRQIDPNEVVQTGPGLPSWGWQSWQLRWQGPVFKDHHVRLWLLSPGLMLLVRLTCVLLFLLMGLVVVAPSRLSMRPGAPLFDLWSTLRRALTPLLLGALALLAAQLVAPATGFAQEQVQQAQLSQLDAPPTMSEPMLRELEQRLIRAQRCEGPCVTASRLDVEISGQTIVLRAEVHAQRAAGWALPGPGSLLRISAVTVDGLPTRQLRREGGGLVAVRLSPGRHQVVVRAELPRQDVITVQLDPAARPQYVSVNAPDWAVDGLDETGRPESSLQLSRRAPTPKDTAKPAEDEAARELPPWYAVERTIGLGMPWQTTTVVRRVRSDRPQLIKIPLLPRESVITEDVRVEDGHALVQMARGVEEFSYTSELAITEAIKLTAPADKPWTETWILECSRIWRCGYDGLVPTHTVSELRQFQPMWQPWPGESLTLTIRKPQGVPGAASTITRADYEITPGERLLAATLRLEARASQGGWQKITLPEGAQLQEVKINDQPRTLRQEGMVLDIPLTPGKQTIEIRWQQPWARSVTEGFPVVDLGGNAVNLHMVMNLGDRRWLLWTWGPDWGPAVLFWSHLALLIVLASLLGRLKRLPIGTVEWLLLAIGMSQLPILAMLPPLLWFGAMVWRKERPATRWFMFNLGQLGLIALTVLLLITFYAAVHTNLLVDIDMQVRGADSSNGVLRWYVDRIAGPTPAGGVLTLPLLVWRIAMLFWALWMVVRLLTWLPWGWRSLSDGGLWRPAPPPAPYVPKGPGPPGGSPPPAAGGPAGPARSVTAGHRPVSGAEDGSASAPAGEASGEDAKPVSTREVPTDSVAAILTQAANPEDEGATRTYTRPDHLKPDGLPDEPLEAGVAPSAGEPPTLAHRVPVATMAFSRPAASTPEAEQLAPNPPAALGMEQRATDELPAVEDGSTGLYMNPASEAGEQASEPPAAEPAQPPLADEASSKRTAMFTMPVIVASPAADEDEDEDEGDGDGDGPLGGLESRTTVFAIPGNSHAEEVEEEAPAEAPPAADEAPSRATAQLTSLKHMQVDEDAAPSAVIRRKRGASASSDELPIAAAPAPSPATSATGPRTLMINAAAVFAPTSARGGAEDVDAEDEEAGPLAEEPHERTAMMTSPSQAFSVAEDEDAPARVAVPGIKPLKPKDE